MWQKFVNRVRYPIQKNVEWIQEERRPSWRPDPGDLKYAEEVMELAYYQREMRTERGAGDVEQMRADRSKRRQQGQSLGMRCPGNWECKKVAHWCTGEGCCDAWAEAVGDTFQVVMVVVFTVLPNIAANKWLSVWPLMAGTVFVLPFHNVFFWKHFGMRLGTRYKMTEQP